MLWVSNNSGFVLLIFLVPVVLCKLKSQNSLRCLSTYLQQSFHVEFWLQFTNTRMKPLLRANKHQSSDLAPFITALQINVTVLQTLQRRCFCKQRLGSHLCSDTISSHCKVTCRTQSAPCISSWRPASMSPGPGAPLLPQISSQPLFWLLREWDHPHWKLQRKKEEIWGSAWENSSIIQKEQGTVFGGYFFSKEIHKGCVVQRKENLDEKVRETCRTRILLSCETKLSCRAAQVCGQCFN